MRFVLVRHAQSENNRVWAEAGAAGGLVHDPALSVLGVVQAAALASHAHSLPWRPTHLYSSLLTRAWQTAAPFGEALGLPVVGHGPLHEVGGPTAPGRDDVGESVEDAVARAERVVGWLRRRHHPDDVVALVTHGWFIQQLLRALLGSFDGVWFTMHNTGVTLLADADAGLPCPVEVRCVNSTAHLPGHWLTQ